MITLFGRTTTIADNGFIPTNIDGCVLWLRADGIVGLNDNDPIEIWEDESGGNFHFTQTEEDNQPLYKTNILNSKPIVRADGIDDRMQNDNVYGQIGGTAKATFFYVASVADIERTEEILMGIRYNGKNRTEMGFCATDDMYQYICNNGVYHGVESDILVNNAFNIVVVVYDGTQSTDATKLRVWRNGIERTLTYLSPIPTTLWYTIYDWFDLFDSKTGVTWKPFYGDLAECGIYTVAITDEQVAQLNSYLNTKYLIY